MLDETGCETIRDPQRCMLLGEEEIGELAEQNAPIATYMDPSLRDSPGLYYSFVQV